MAGIGDKLIQTNTGYDDIKLQEDAVRLTQKLYAHNRRKRDEQVRQLINMCTVVKDKDILIIHSPGGWGCADLTQLIDWEKSILDGVRTVLTDMGMKWEIIQFFRSRFSLWSQMENALGQAGYMLTGKLKLASVLADELRFVNERNKDIKILLLGVSQGAAFNNTVMKLIPDLDKVFSIEPGNFFLHLPRRVITSRTLAIDDNGIMPDPVVHLSPLKTIKSFVTAPYYWIRYRAAGRRVKFTYCINVPGHDYNWQYPAVQKQITDFLYTNFR